MAYQQKSVADSFMGKKKFVPYKSKGKGNIVAPSEESPNENSGIDDDEATEDVTNNLGPAKKKARAHLIKTSKVKF